MSRTRSFGFGAAALCASTLIACGPGKVDTIGPPPTSVPIRRLTNAEYTATVTDLFPGYMLPQLSFVPDAKVLGFLNLSSSQTGSLVRMEQYEAAAFAIAQKVTADPTDADRLRRRRAGRGVVRRAVPRRFRQARVPASAHRRRAGRPAGAARA